MKRMNMNKVVKNLFWKFGERIFAQGVTFVVSIILARILDPTDYGTVAIVVTFITLANVFVTCGFGTALIQKKDADKLDFSSILIVNLIVGIGIYIIIYFLSPLISNFYNMDLTNVFRVLALKIPLASINSVQQAYVARRMEFKKFFWSTSIGTVISAGVGIALAFCGYGVWALVFQYLVNSFIDTIVLTIVIRKFPGWKVSFERVKLLLRFGVPILLSNLLYNFCNELSNLIIGKKYSSEDLAFFSKGKQLPHLVVNNINVSVSSVLFPALSKFQDDRALLLDKMRKSMKMSCYLMTPFLMGLIIVAEPTVNLLLTEKWLFCVPYLQLFCIFYLFQPIQTSNLEALKAIGESKLVLKLEIIKRISQIVILLISLNFGVLGIAIGNIIASFIRSFINAFPNKKIFNYSYLQQIFDLLPTFLITIVMCVIVYFVGFINLPSILLLVIQVFVGFAVYLLLSIVTKNDSFIAIKDQICKLLKTNRKEKNNENK